MESIKHETVDYYIIFTKTTLKHWIFRFLDKEIQHCYAVKQSPGGHFWIIIDPTTGFTSIRMESVDEFPSIRALCPDQVIINVRAKATEECRQWVRQLNCVEIVKTLIGLKNIFIVTPFQLYKYLAR